MRTDLNEIQHHTLFTSPVNSLRFSIEEITKMFEARMENLTKYLCDNELTQASFKNIKSEVFRSIDGFISSLDAHGERLKRNMEKAFDKIEESNSDTKV